MEAMRWRCNKTAQEESKMCRKRKDGEGDQGMRKRKKVRKLRYNKVEADWSLEETGIQAMEDQEVARTRFLHSDRSRAKVGNIQTTIRIWTETEMFARKMIIDCLDNVQKEAEKNYLRETTRWLECEEAGEEFYKTPDGWKPDIVDDVPHSWEPGESAKRLEKEDGNDDAQQERTESQGGLDNLGEVTRGLEGNESPDKIQEGRSSGKNKFRIKQSKDSSKTKSC